jgi:flagellar assembly protein FliH
MPILKAQQHTPFVKDAIVLDLGDIGRQAARLRMAAETKAAAIMTDAEKKARALIEGAEARGFDQGKQAGFVQGLEEGREQGAAEALASMRDQLQQVQTAWIDVAQQLDNGRKEMMLEARQAVLNFALQLAEKLVHRVIEVDPTVVVDQVAGALSHVLRPMDVAVQVHPEDKPLLERSMPELMAEFPRLGHIALRENEDVSRGGCVVTYGQGEVDATLETQMRRIVDLVLPGATPGEGYPDAADDVNSGGAAD